MAQNTITTKGVLIINGKQIENTFDKLRATTSKLEKELRKLNPGTQAFIEKAQQVKLARQAFENIRNEINATTRELQKSEGVVGKVIKTFGGLGGIFTIGASVSLASTTQELLKISDAITDVQKTSGLAQKEVEELWKEFSNFDTRTSKLELMNIAQIGGRLGITDKEQLQEFTREIDKIYVALGDSFQGGLEEVTTKVGKLKNLFDETKNSDYGSALNEIGSALNELGANGTASESNITEFATRIGQLPNALKPAIDKTLGLGAAFEESGIDAQIASSGYSRFMSVAGNNLEGFAKQMKITTEEATALFRTNPEEFFIKFGESIKNLSADETSKSLKDLDLNTLEIKKSLGAAGDNANRFREMMQLSSKAMIEGISIQNEFNQKNENAAAIWEKIGNGLRNFITDGVVPDFFNWVTGIVGKITGVISEAGDGIERFRARLGFIIKTLAVVTAAVLSYRTAIWLVATTTKGAWQQTVLYNTVLKVQAALKRAGAAATYLFSAAKLALTGNTQRATVAMRAFSMAVRANPIGLLVTAVTTAITALALFSKKTDEATKKQRLLNDIQNSVTSKMREEVQEIEDLVSVIRDENTAREDKEEALKRLQEIAPEYFKNLDIEKLKTLEGKRAIDEYIKSLDRKHRKQVLDDKIGEKKDEYNKELTTKNVISKNSSWNPLNWFRSNEDYEATYEAQLAKEMAKWDKGLEKGTISEKKYQAILKSREKFLKEIYENKENDLKSIKKEIQTLEEERKKLIEEDLSLILGKPKEGDDDDINVGNKSKSPKKYTGDVYGQAQKELLKAQRDFIKKQQELEDEETAVLQDSLDKQLSAVETKYERKKLALQQENEDFINEIKELNKKIREANEKIADKETSDEEKADNRRAIGVYKKIIAEKRNLIEQNNKMEVTLESTKNHELDTTREKYFTKIIQTQVQEFEKCINLKKVQNDYELSQIKTLEEAKEKLQAQGYEGQLHKIRTLEEAKKELKKQADKAILQETLKSLEAQQQLLTEGIKAVSGESAEKLIADLEKLEEKVLQIKAAIAGENTEKTDTSSIKGTEAEGVDILGFTAGQWEDTFTKLDTTEGKLKAVGMAMQALANAGQLFADAQRNANERELRQFTSYQERRKKTLESQLNNGIITQEQYYLSVREMEAEAANKKAEMEYKQAKAEKVARLFSAVGSTAQAVAQALTAGPIMGPILAGIVGALGAVQIGIIASQPLPQKQSYAKGGYTQGIGFTDHSGHEVAGVVHAGEYVIPEWLLKDPQVANVAQWLEARRIGNERGMANNFDEGGYTTPTNSSPTLLENNGYMIDALNRFTELIERLERDGIEAFLIEDAQNGKKMHNAIKKYKDLNNRSKQ